MRPWKISFGLTITLAALGVPLGMETGIRNWPKHCGGTPRENGNRAVVSRLV